MPVPMLDDFKVRRLSFNDVENVSKFLAKYYTGENNFLKLIRGMTDEDIIQYNNSRVETRLKQPYSVGIFEKSTDKLVNVALGYVRELKATSNNNDEQDKRSRFSPMQLALNFVKTLEGDLYELLHVNRVHEIGMGVTHPDYKNYGFAIFTIKACRELAKSSECEYIITKPAIEYSCRWVERNEPENILKQIYYADYVDPVSGENPFVEAKFPYIRSMIICHKVNCLPEMRSPVMQSLL